MTIPVHTSREPSPSAQGRALGAAWRAELTRTAASYVDLFAAHGVRGGQVRDWGAAALAATRDWAPGIADEIEGVAAGAGLEPWLLGALNGRTEILAAAAVGGEGECSTSVALPGGGVTPRTVQTWDWHDTLADVMLLRDLEVRPGLRVCTFTEFGIAAKIGVNSAGLGLHFNVLRHASDHPGIGVPVHVVARRILAETSTVEEAVAVARSARLSASSVLTVVTADAASCLELSPAGVAELPAVDGNLLHTNHFLDPVLAPGERTVAAESSTAARLAELRARTSALNAQDRTDRATALLVHGPDGAPLCAHADPALPPHTRWASLATISIDVAARRIDVHEGGPCRVSADTWQSLSAKETL
ncbi:C45 family autoproteolytic acyltransferase/hydolase [Actinophytocola glycyrrhizae]|uniref:C45 family autoproteolytic acyltransferase/hydrolase n=1 Tax=Actinophytocola glycyrrhizae TaxID=2044873 RepID=A0ABV9RVQ2_9PSEU